MKLEHCYSIVDLNDAKQPKVSAAVYGGLNSINDFFSLHQFTLRITQANGINAPLSRADMSECLVRLKLKMIKKIVQLPVDGKQQGETERLDS